MGPRGPVQTAPMGGLAPLCLGGRSGWRLSPGGYVDWAFEEGMERLATSIS